VFEKRRKAQKKTVFTFVSQNKKESVKHDKNEKIDLFDLVKLKEIKK
jgi:hypothetical protein